MIGRERGLPQRWIRLQLIVTAKRASLTRRKIVGTPVSPCGVPYMIPGFSCRFVNFHVDSVCFHVDSDSLEQAQNLGTKHK